MCHKGTPPYERKEPSMLEKKMETATVKFMRRIYPQTDSIGIDTFCVSLMVLDEPFKELGKGEVLKVSGVGIPSTPSGLVYEILGEYEQHEKYGDSLKAAMVSPIMPTTLSGIKAILASGLIEGIGKKTAEKIVDTFGKETLLIIEAQPEKLLQIKGVSERMVAKIKASNIALSRELHAAVEFLQEKEFSVQMAIRIGKHFRGRTVEVLTQNPYAITEIEGIGFQRADAFARKMGITERLDPRRVEAGLMCCFSEIQNEGHLCYSEKATVVRTLKILGCCITDINTRAINDQIGRAKSNGKIMLHRHDGKDFLYSVGAYRAEDKAAASLSSLIRRKPENRHDEKVIRRLIGNVCNRLMVCLDDLQEAGIVAALMNNVSIVTGGPGTGKTTLLNVLVETFQDFEDLPVTLLAPTGRAARRMSEATGKDARTIHSALGLRPGESETSMDVSLFEGLVVVDEMSMVDGYVFKNLVTNLGLSARLVLIGDVDQLPSVGPGAVLKSLIQSGRIPVTRLSKTFRQKGGSAIIGNAARINAGETDLEEVEGEFQMIEINGEEAQQKAVIEAYLDGRKKYGQDNIVLLTPFRKRGALSCNVLNNMLQKIINPESNGNATIKIFGAKEASDQELCFRIGDPVTAKKNFVEKDISNGDVGTVTEIDGRIMHVKFDDDREFDISGEELYAFDLAYATTVHKSQGSEYKMVVMVCSSAHRRMLKRNLVYTGLTRSKIESRVIFDQNALKTAVATVDQERRGTFLASMLQTWCII